MPKPPRRQFVITRRVITTWYVYTAINAGFALLSFALFTYILMHAHAGPELIWRILACIGLAAFAAISIFEIERFWNTDTTQDEFAPYGWFTAISESYYAWRLKRYRRRSRY